MTAESQKNENTAGEPKPWSARIAPYADIVLKLTPAVFTAVGGWLAATYQSQSAGISLLNQRELAETQLRASMFASLIGPIAGPRGLSPEDERLLVELLALNFHEHVEFKPLLLHADNRLATKMNELPKASAARLELVAMRRSLRSVVRRVIDRQLAALQQECSHTSGGLCSVSSLADRNNCAEPGSDAKPLNGNPQCILFLASDANNIERRHAVTSPDGKYQLRISMGEADWEKKTVEMQVSILESASGKQEGLGTLDFTVTPYDLPFTDNTPLDNSHRFSLVVKDMFLAEDLPGVAPKDWVNRVTLWVAWFPQGYVLPHERPVNYQEIRKVLKLD